jgi:hypothetical protein
MRKSLLVSTAIVAMLFAAGLLQPAIGAMKSDVKFQNHSNAYVKLTVHDVLWDSHCIKPGGTFTKGYDVQPSLVVADFHHADNCSGSKLYYKTIAGFHKNGYVAAGKAGSYSFNSL